MTKHERELLKVFYLEQAPRWGREAAECDNELMAGIWRECNVRHRRGVMREIDALPDDHEARRLFAAAYDATIDYSIPEWREEQ